MNKVPALFFYGRDVAAARALAAAHRKVEGAAFLRDAFAFKDSEPAEPVDLVFVLPCVQDAEMKRIVAVYGDKVKVPSVIAAPPPLAPVDADAVATLPADWKDNVSTKELKAIAAAVSGRTVDNRAQAVELVTAEIARRAAPPPPPPLPPPPVS